MLEALTGTGLATAAGLNAYIPLLTVGALARYTDVISLPESWRWLEHPVVLAIVAALLVIEVVADKVPVVDHINDIVQTVVRPTAGGLVFGASASSETVTVNNPSDFFSNHAWVPVVVGIVLSLAVHGVKASARQVINATTMGVGAPVVSTVEDGISVSMSIVAIVMPLLVLLLLVGVAALVWWVFRRITRRRAQLGVPAAGAGPG
jgi:hypothetical protein